MCANNKRLCLTRWMWNLHWVNGRIEVWIRVLFCVYGGHNGLPSIWYQCKTRSSLYQHRSGANISIKQSRYWGLSRVVELLKTGYCNQDLFSIVRYFHFLWQTNNNNNVYSLGNTSNMFHRTQIYWYHCFRVELTKHCAEREVNHQTFLTKILASNWGIAPFPPSF